VVDRFYDDGTGISHKLDDGYLPYHCVDTCNLSFHVGLCHVKLMDSLYQSIGRTAWATVDSIFYSRVQTMYGWSIRVHGNNDWFGYRTGRDIQRDDTLTMSDIYTVKFPEVRYAFSTLFDKHGVTGRFIFRPSDEYLSNAQPGFYDFEVIVEKRINLYDMLMDLKAMSWFSRFDNYDCSAEEFNDITMLLCAYVTDVRFQYYILASNSETVAESDLFSYVIQGDNLSMSNPTHLAVPVKIMNLVGSTVVTTVAHPGSSDVPLVGLPDGLYMVVAGRNSRTALIKRNNELYRIASGE